MCQLASGQTMYDPTSDPYPGVGGPGYYGPSSYIPSDVLVPTLDDVPDGPDPSMAKTPGNWTASDLKDFLDTMAYLNSFRMDFFINTNNACDITGTANPMCTATLVDILKMHNPGNHTIHHWHLGTPGAGGCGNAACVTSELAGVESVVSMLSAGGIPHLTRFRAPFGEPYQAMGSGINFVPAAVAKFAVAVGWNLDSDDSNHDDGTNCTGPCPTGASIAHTVETIVGTPGSGTNGIILMHGIFGWTHDALKILFDPVTGYAAKNHFRIGTVEDVICWKYGMHSWTIVNTLNHYTGAQARGPN
jgi:hypothetical protein